MDDLPTARDAMTDWYCTFRPETDIVEAIESLVRKRAAGAPVVDEEERLVGVITEKDSLRVLANAAYGEQAGGRVGEHMSRVGATVTPDMDLFAVAHVFLQTNFPVLPVTDHRGRLLGRISRQDMLRQVHVFMRRLHKQGRRLSGLLQGQKPSSIEAMQRMAASASPDQLADMMRDRENG
ncbi:MAG TPA: CBS domain-containing protein [Thermoanaerobaculia bacterium]|nr:CBS domain-containing protein [Thermoanaerobaculia bacterium]